jgi:fumarate hydratase class II
MEYRIEKDSMGEFRCRLTVLGGTDQRSLENFKIGVEKMPPEIIRAFGYLKKAAAIANNRLGKLDAERCGLIARSAGKSLKAGWMHISRLLSGRQAAAPSRT